LTLNLIIIGIVFAVFTTSCYFFVERHFAASYKMVQDLDRLNEEVELIKEALIDQETGQRGYALTGDESFLEPYHFGTLQFDNLTLNMPRTLEQFPVLRDPIQNMIESGQHWHDQYGEPEVWAKQHRQEITLERLKEGKQAFDAFRKTAQQSVEEINKMKVDIGSGLENSVDLVLLTISMLSIMLALVTMWMMIRKFRSLVTPIIELEQCVSEYANRNFDVPVPQASLDDELGLLITGVDRMRQELKEGFLQTQRLAEIDGLTGVANRRAYDRAVLDLVSRAEQGGGTFSLILIDIDHFKLFNDRYGHLEGDAVLRHVASVITRHLRPFDLLARYGGEEFAVLMPHGATLHRHAEAERLRAAIEQETLEPYRITASLGVADYAPGETGVALFERADAALYHAKAAGRNRVEISENGHKTLNLFEIL
jgi:diguanylate cyclase (GGDEF)-like protein